MKERILDLTRNEIQRKGFRFAMGDLARQVGISTKTLYSFYSSKIDLIDELLEMAIFDMRRREEEILNDTNKDTLEKLKKILVLVPTEFQFFNIRYLEELQRYYPNQWKKIDEFVLQQWEGAINLINEGIGKGLFRSFNVELFLETYIGGLYRIMEQSLERGESVTLSEALQGVVELLLFGIVERKSKNISENSDSSSS